MHKRGEKDIRVHEETSAEDVGGMNASDGFLVTWRNDKPCECCSERMGSPVCRRHEIDAFSHP